jgi:transcriptional regulator with XRE-family HTH domain
MDTKLKDCRKAKGLTQAQLAEAAGVPVRTIQGYECGRKPLKKAAYETVEALARALKMEMKDLF